MNLTPKCRFCGAGLERTVVDLGMSPLCESYVDNKDLDKMEAFYPLRVYVCEDCYLVQLLEYVKAKDIYTEYAYFSSYSDSWLAHARAYVKMITERLRLDGSSKVFELASNDGYLLQYFVEQGIGAVGIEPAANIAKVANDKGIKTIPRFFGLEVARDLVAEGSHADLLLGNNVLAHVPDINDFVAGMKVLLASGGVITMEFPHLLRLIEGNQFDTIYHEHFSYLSFLTVQKIFGAHGLKVFDVEELPTHGGSLRIYGCHAEDETRPICSRVQALKAAEEEFGLMRVDTYSLFAQKVKETKFKLLRMLIGLKSRGKVIVGYGAPGKGNTLLNYCGIRTDFLDYTVDRNPYKHFKVLPGTHIPIYAPEKIRQTRPDYLLILPWNLRDEIVAQNDFIREWGGRFIVPIPEPEIL
ncbi:class I SAM-dependent methyltransferase [Thioalkalicoccus limnaeus]|uniref:Class I SAM-dependent methyltransferase n=1 Tax=Thioalkalicoccus limnaeus TaxID=120681 RepID=A0ABV4BC39_9GAMM